MAVTQNLGWSQEIRNPLLKNATFLLPYRHRSFENYQLEMIKKVVSRFNETSPEVSYAQEYVIPPLEISETS